MVSVLDFLREYPYFFQNEPLAASTWCEVSDQAIRHTERTKEDSGFDDARPNEDEKIKEYRNKNKRRITTEGVNKFQSSTARTFQNAGISLQPDTIDEVLNEWFATNPFEEMGQKMDMMSFLYTCLVPLALRDPNAAIIPFPYSNNDEAIAPIVFPEEGGADGNIAIPIRPKIIPSEKIVTPHNLQGEIFAFRGGVKAYIYKGEEQKGEFYFVADKQFWYTYAPVGRDPKTGKVIYKAEKWYEHKLDELPNTSLPGRLHGRHLDGKYFKYHESIIHSYYEWADEALNAFSDGQAVRVRHVHPKVIMQRVTCQSCKGKKKLATLKSGIEQFDKGVKLMHDCTSCHGTGYIPDPSPYAVLHQPETGGMRTDKASGARPDVLKYVQAPGDAVRFAIELPEYYLGKALSSIGLDTAHTEGAESADAKRLRMEAKYDILSEFSSQLFKCFERFLGLVVRMRAEGLNEVELPKFKKPNSYEYKPESLLLLEAKEALTADKLQAEMQFVSAKYRGNRKMIRVYELAYKYAPELLFSREEKQMRIGAGFLERNDLTRADYAICAFKEIAERLCETDSGTLEFFSMKRGGAKDLADAWMREEGLLQSDSIPLIES